MATTTSRSSVSWWRRVGWLVLIWAASVTGLSALALVFRGLMRFAGMSN